MKKQLTEKQQQVRAEKQAVKAMARLANAEAILSKMLPVTIHTEYVK